MAQLPTHSGRPIVSHSAMKIETQAQMACVTELESLVDSSRRKLASQKLLQAHHGRMKHAFELDDTTRKLRGGDIMANAHGEEAKKVR